MPTISALGDLVRAKLNDTEGQLYSDAVLLPHFKSAWMVLQGEMRSAGIPVTRDSGALITVPAGTVELTVSTTPALPSDIINIIEIHEKAVGAPDSEYELMDDVTFTPDMDQSSELGYYSWIEGKLLFIGSTQDRVIRIRYVRYLTDISASSTNITVPGVEDYLINKTAALAAILIGQNRTRGDYLEGQAASAKDKYLNTETKGKQGDPVQRKPYGFSRRLFRWHTR